MVAFILRSPIESRTVHAFYNIFIFVKYFFKSNFDLMESMPAYGTLK
jgi:hypothetical protein